MCNDLWEENRTLKEKVGELEEDKGSGVERITGDREMGAGIGDKGKMEGI
jgi:hypothetical protein